MLETVYLYRGYIYCVIICAVICYVKFFKFRFFKYKFIGAWYKFIREQNNFRFFAMEYFLKQNNDSKTLYDIIYTFLFDDSISETFGPPTITYKERKGLQLFDYEYAILNKYGVCRHIAFIFFIVCTYHSLYCSIYYGKYKAPDEQKKIIADNHAWNSIKINNKEYVVDLTNPVFENNDLPKYIISEDKLSNYRGKKYDKTYRIIKKHRISLLVRLLYFFLPIKQ